MMRLVVLVAVLALGRAAWGQASQTVNPAVWSNIEADGFAWLTPGNAASSNNSRTQQTLNAPEDEGDWLTGLGGFSIPAGSLITGIAVSIEARTLATAESDLGVVQLELKGEAIGDHEAVTLTTTESVYTLGGPGELWGMSLLEAADINADSFGVRIQSTARAEVTSIAQIDHVSITVYYTEPKETPENPPASGFRLIAPTTGAVPRDYAFTRLKVACTYFQPVQEISFGGGLFGFEPVGSPLTGAAATEACGLSWHTQVSPGTRTRDLRFVRLGTASTHDIHPQSVLVTISVTGCLDYVFEPSTPMNLLHFNLPISAQQESGPGRLAFGTYNNDCVGLNVLGGRHLRFTKPNGANGRYLTATSSPTVSAFSWVRFEILEDTGAGDGGGETLLPTLEDIKGLVQDLRNGWFVHPEGGEHGPLTEALFAIRDAVTGPMQVSLDEIVSELGAIKAHLGPGSAEPFEGPSIEPPPAVPQKYLDGKLVDRYTGLDHGLSVMDIPGHTPYTPPGGGGFDGGPAPPHWEFVIPLGQAAAAFGSKVGLSDVMWSPDFSMLEPWRPYWVGLIVGFFTLWCMANVWEELRRY